LGGGRPGGGAPAGGAPAAVAAALAGAGAELAGVGAASPPPPALFTFVPTAGSVWFTPLTTPSPALESRYRAAGWLAAQAVAARSPLGIPLPPVLFARLLQGPAFEPTLEALADFDAGAAAAARAAPCQGDGAYAAAAAAAGLPACTPRHAFPVAAARAFLVDGVAWQFAALAAGWRAGADARALARWRLTPDDLAAIVGGDPPVHAPALRAAAMAAAPAAARAPTLADVPSSLPPLPPLRKAGAVPRGVHLDVRATEL